MSNSFEKRFGFKPKSRDIRLHIVQRKGLDDLSVDKSIFVPDEDGLFANRDFKAGELLGIYHGVQCKYDDLVEVARTTNNGVDRFYRKYGITSKLSSHDTLLSISKLSFALDNERVLVMPRYPIDTAWYHSYNAMLFVNEPPDTDSRFNPHTNANQHSETNVLAFNNYEWSTIDYVCSRDIVKGEELLVSYGKFYNRDYTTKKF